MLSSRFGNFFPRRVAESETIQGRDDFAFSGQGGSVRRYRAVKSAGSKRWLAPPALLLTARFYAAACHAHPLMSNCGGMSPVPVMTTCVIYPVPPGQLPARLP